LTGDAALKPLGFGSWVNFDGGTLGLLAPWTTVRDLSLLAGGGTIDTGTFQARVLANTANEGTLVKRDSGLLELRGTSRHAGTVVQAGTLVVSGTHPGPITVEGGTLAGNGSLGVVSVVLGTVQPTVPSGSTSLHATQLLMSPGTQFAVTIAGVPEGFYARLDAGYAEIDDAVLSIVSRVRQPAGTSFTILTTATGRFAGLAEGDLIATALGSYQISYAGGPSGTDVVLTAF
jgi:hypothetical protein